jgi:multidrug efflux system outer membrane protein
MKIPIVGLGLILMFACTMEPKYQQPNLPVVNEWPTSDGLLQQENLISWQAFFKSPELAKIIEIALVNNSNLKDAVLKIEAARALYRIKGGELYPKFWAEANGSRKKVPEKASSNGVEHINASYDVNLNTSYEIDLFGRVRSLNRAALEDFLATQEAKNAIQISLIAEVANAYLQWLSDSRLLNISKENLVVLEQIANLVTKSHESGITNKLEILQANAALEAGKVTVALYERRVAQDKNGLTLLIGKDVPEIFGVAIDLEMIDLAQDIPVGLPSFVLLNRPDVKAAEHQLKSMNANIGVARAAYFPKISLTAAYGFSSSSLATLFSGGAVGAWEFAPKITAPIFEYGTSQANLKNAKIKKEIAVVQYEKAIQMAFREVSDELVARKFISEQQNAQKNVLNQMKAIYEVQKSRYENGVTRLSILLEASRNLNSARLSLIEIEKIRLTNSVNLFKALGGGGE